jgi:hypothetical protein
LKYFEVPNARVERMYVVASFRTRLASALKLKIGVSN